MVAFQTQITLRKDLGRFGNRILWRGFLDGLCVVRVFRFSRLLVVSIKSKSRWWWFRINKRINMKIWKEKHRTKHTLFAANSAFFLSSSAFFSAKISFNDFFLFFGSSLLVEEVFDDVDFLSSSSSSASRASHDSWTLSLSTSSSSHWLGMGAATAICGSKSSFSVCIIYFSVV